MEIRNFINEENIIKDDIYDKFKEVIICPICFGIYIEPMMCKGCLNVYCKECIDNWTKKDKRCPNRCENPDYVKSKDRAFILSTLKFQCKKCNKIIEYLNMFKHKDLNCKQEDKNENKIINEIKENNNSILQEVVNDDGNSINVKNNIKFSILSKEVGMQLKKQNKNMKKINSKFY